MKTLKDALTVARALRGVPLEKAPATLLPAVLRRVGLADSYWRLESPVGPVYIAHSKAGISMVRRAKSPAEFEREHWATPRKIIADLENRAQVKV